jgi:hypothetical protein
MSFLAGVGAVFKGFFSSIWEAMRRRRKDQELIDNARRQAESESLKHAVEASKKARKVDDKIMSDERSFDDLIDRM